MAWPTTTIVTTQMDAATDDPSQARAEIKQMAENVNAIKDMRGVADGIASLDAGGKVPATQLPTTPATQGGTGQTTYTVGDILYASAAGTLSKLSAGVLGYVLTSNGPGNAPSWQMSAGGLETGTRLAFNQTNAPTGWTKDTTAALNDSIMRIVTGTVGSGGSNAFSTFNGQTSVGATTLTIAQMPSHTHTLPVPFIGNGIPNVAGSSGGLSTQSQPVSAAQGGGGSHTHTITTAIKYNDFIIASKD